MENSRLVRLPDASRDELRSKKIEFVYSDLSKEYLNVIKSRCPHALNILNRFHVKGHLTKAVDETRRLDVAKLKEKKGKSVDEKSIYFFEKS